MTRVIRSYLRAWCWRLLRRAAFAGRGLAAFGPAARGRQRVLFLSHHAYSDAYMAPLAAALAERPGVDLYVARATPPGAETSAAGFAGARRLPLPLAIVCRFDLIVDAFPFAAKWFAAAIPKLHLVHGINAGKYDDDGDFTYSPRRTARGGRLLYDAIACPSRLERSLALAAWPRLAPALVVAGDVRFDALLAARRRRTELRRERGIAPEHQVVLVMSTWGTDSLLSTHGPALIAALEPLLERYRIILSIHDLHWRHGADRWREAGQPMGGFWLDRERMLADLAGRGFLLNENRCSERSLACADAVVSDYTSFSLYAAAAGLPIVQSAVPAGTLLEGYPGERLSRAAISFRSVGELGGKIASALRDGPGAELQALGEVLVDCQGEAVRRQMRLIDALLRAPAAARAGVLDMPADI